MPRSQALRIVSYNVRYFGHALKGLASTRGPEHRIARALSILDPFADVVCLQEIETISLRSRLARGRREEGETQLASFMAALERAFAALGKPFPYDGFYFRAHANCIRKVNVTTHGLAILVNTRRLRVESHNVDSPHHITHHHVERFRDRKQARICAHIHVADPSGRRLHVFNTHISLPTPFARGFWTAAGQDGLGPEPAPRGPHAGHLRGAARRGRALRGLRGLQLGARVAGVPVPHRGGRVSAAPSRTWDSSTADDARGWPTAGFMRMRMHLDHLFFGNGVRFLDLDGSLRFGDRKSPFAGLSDHVPLIGRLRCDAHRA